MRVRMGTSWYTFACPIEDHPLDARRAPSALEGWILRSFIATRKGVGRFCGSFLRKGEVFAYVRQNQSRKDLKNLKDRYIIELCTRIGRKA